ERHRRTRLLRAPGELRRIARYALLQADAVGILRLRHEVEALRRLLGERGTVDDDAVLGVEMPRALVVIHRADVQDTAVEHQQLGVQAVVTVTRKLFRLTGTARVLGARTDLVQLHARLEQSHPIVHVARLRRVTAFGLERAGENAHRAL